MSVRRVLIRVLIELKIAISDRYFFCFRGIFLNCKNAQTLGNTKKPAITGIVGFLLLVEHDA